MSETAGWSMTRGAASIGRWKSSSREIARRTTFETSSSSRGWASPSIFLFDRGKLRLSGWCLADASARSYQPLLPQRGRFASAMLGLEIGIVDNRLRFFHLDSELPDAEELIQKLERAVDNLEARAEEESRRAEEESRRAEEEFMQRGQAEARLADALAELERLKQRS